MQASHHRKNNVGGGGGQTHATRAATATKIKRQPWLAATERNRFSKLKADTCLPIVHSTLTTTARATEMDTANIAQQREPASNCWGPTPERNLRRVACKRLRRTGGAVSCEFSRYFQ